MHKLLALLLSLSLTVSCGKLFKDDVVTVDGARMFETSDPAFSSYIEKFEEFGKAELNDPSFVVGDVPINFGDTQNENYDGVCLLYSNGQKEIIVKKSWWDEAPETQKIILVFHEFGHCRLDRGHEDGEVQVNGQHYKVSIMNPIIPSSRSYLEFKDGYITELFQQTTESLLTLMGWVAPSEETQEASSNVNQSFEKGNES